MFECFLEQIFVKIHSSSFIMLSLFSCQNSSKNLILFILFILIFDRKQVFFDLLFEQKLRWYILLGSVHCLVWQFSFLLLTLW